VQSSNTGIADHKYFLDISTSFSRERGINSTILFEKCRIIKEDVALLLNSGYRITYM